MFDTSDTSRGQDPMIEIEWRGHLQYPFAQFDVCSRVITDGREADVVWVADATPIIPRMIHTHY